MNINPLLLDERYDDGIFSMMYQPLNEEMKIKVYNPNELDESIYEYLAHIEEFKAVKL
jgi:hypothetical protein